MPKLKRDIVKYVRDKAKSKYEKGSSQLGSPRIRRQP